MKLGAVFQQTEIGNDTLAICDYAQVVEGMGYRHLLIFPVESDYSATGVTDYAVWTRKIRRR
jgi:hypothetical protein